MPAITKDHWKSLPGAVKTGMVDAILYGTCLTHVRFDGASIHFETIKQNHFRRMDRDAWYRGSDEVRLTTMLEF